MNRYTHHITIKSLNDLSSESYRYNGEIQMFSKEDGIEIVFSHREIPLQSQTEYSAFSFEDLDNQKIIFKSTDHFFITELLEKLQ